MEKEVVLDVCGMQPPEPLEHVLGTLSRMTADQRLRILIDREPRPLYAILEQNGYAYDAHHRNDWLYEILIWQRQ